MNQYSRWARWAVALCALWLAMSGAQAGGEEDGCRWVGGIWVCD